MYFYIHHNNTAPFISPVSKTGAGMRSMYVSGFLIWAWAMATMNMLWSGQIHRCSLWDIHIDLGQNFWSLNFLKKENKYNRWIWSWEWVSLSAPVIGEYYHADAQSQIRFYVAVYFIQKSDCMPVLVTIYQFPNPTLVLLLLNN